VAEALELAAAIPLEIRAEMEVEAVMAKQVRSNSAFLTDASSSLRCACGAAKRGR
jgi:hypothetical protein